MVRSDYYVSELVDSKVIVATSDMSRSEVREYMDDSDSITASGDERAAIEEIERGLEWFHRAHGALVEFHHAIGRGMEHFQAAEDRLREDHTDLADRVREDILPAGVTADDKLTYELVAEFEEGLLPAVESVADATFDELADGRRYPIERSERGD